MVTQKINSAAGLRLAIIELEMKQAREGKELKEHFHVTCESIKPANLIKSTFREAVSAPGLQTNILNTSLGLAAGYISKLLFVNVSHSPLRKILGFALQFGITKLVSKNPEVVKLAGRGIVKGIKDKLAGNTDIEIE